MRKVIRKLDNKGLYVESYSFMNGESRLGFRVFYQSNIKPIGAIFFINGRWQNSLLWAKDNPQRDFRIYFAIRGYIVCSMDYRTNFLSEKTSFLCKEWNTKTFLEDIEYCINLFTNEKKIKKLFIAGYSMGAALGYMLAYQKFNFKVKGFISLDGGNKNFKRQKNKKIEDEIYKLDVLHRGIILNPTHDKKFKRYALQKLSFNSKKILFGENFDNDLLRYLLIQNKMWPSNQVAEMNSISDYDFHPLLTYDQNAHSIKFPIFCVVAVDNLDDIESHRGVVSARQTLSEDVNILALEKWSHVEVIASEKSIKEVWAPLGKWMRIHN